MRNKREGKGGWVTTDGIAVYGARALKVTYAYDGADTTIEMIALSGPKRSKPTPQPATQPEPPHEDNNKAGKTKTGRGAFLWDEKKGQPPIGGEVYEDLGSGFNGSEGRQKNIPDPPY